MTHAEMANERMIPIWNTIAYPWIVKDSSLIDMDALLSSRLGSVIRVSKSDMLSFFPVPTSPDPDMLGCVAGWISE